MSATSDDDLLARVYSMSEDDDPEIERLRHLRAAFRAMPDEDPPERGLADLMAAARAQAEEMTPVPQRMGPGDRVLAVPWWKRLAAMLRRPPVLALASVMVLLGGALLIGRRGDEDVARPTVSATESKPAAATGGAAPAGSGSAAIKGEANEELDRQRFDDGKDTGGAPQAQTKPEPPKPEPVKPNFGGDRPTPKPADEAPPRVSHHTRSPLPATPPPAPPPASADQVKEPKDPAPPKADVDKSAGAKPSQTVQKDELVIQGESAPTTAAPGAVDGRHEGAGRKATPEQLLQQCRVAANRGDCVATKAIAARIEKDDASFYRERVAKDAAVARCLSAK